ncbi:ferritin family protein [Thermococcus sp.]|uniref:ferritin-like domain-containing protein n=1 Tax=Thermococcus sp. TaxID=35749 RepID=UPI00260D3DA2|nr:ferritin family protein [Thermococcus sp.]
MIGESGNFEESLEELRKLVNSLDEKHLLSYWIKGEYEEAKIHGELAKKSEELGLPPSFVSTLRKLAKEDKEHGDSLWRLYLGTYGEEPEEVDITPIEAFSLLRALENPENLEFVFKIIMETELIAKRLYERLSSITGIAGTRDLYTYLANMEWTHYQRLRGEAGLMGIDVGKMEEKFRRKGLL